MQMNQLNYKSSSSLFRRLLGVLLHFNFVRWLHRGIHHGCLFVSFPMSSGWINSISYGGFTPFFKMCYGKRISFEKLNNYHGKWQSCLTRFSERVLSYTFGTHRNEIDKKREWILGMIWVHRSMQRFKGAMKNWKTRFGSILCFVYHHF